MDSEAAFAAMAGVNPIPASSGKTIRHRLNPAGVRQLNRALNIIAMSECSTTPDPRLRSNGDAGKATRTARSDACSSATSTAASTGTSTPPQPKSPGLTGCTWRAGLFCSPETCAAGRLGRQKAPIDVVCPHPLTQRGKDVDLHLGAIGNAGLRPPDDPSAVGTGSP
ncbi:transposase [Microbacterium sp. zg.B48]|uniref:transposase n=1 Tax=Microbacterium sp. zg.B48 TaxID=2969408 RepID=UPI0035A91D52